MANHPPVSVDPSELQRANETWHKFTQLLKYSGAGIAVILALLALAFIR